MSDRLQKILAKAGYGSRRQNEKLIRAGRVRINGNMATLGDKADPGRDTIEVDGKEININPRRYIMLNKPKGVLSSNRDGAEEGRTTVRDLIPLPGHIYPVGRLDKQSEGLILMTNDGDLAHKLTHPRYEHEKVYDVTVEGRPSEQTLERWRRGVMLKGRKTAPAGVTVLDHTGDTTDLRITLREGRKRQIRRVAALLGHPVRRLVRTHIGTLALGDLQPGQWRYLSDEEIQSLKRIVRK